MIETILTKEFCQKAILKVIQDPDLLTTEETRYLIYFAFNPDKCVTEGSSLRCICGNADCVKPNHVEILPPNYQ